jgi:hypothetical protein
MYTVRICRDVTGWFATMNEDLDGYPGVSTHWEELFATSDEAMQGLDRARALAHRLEVAGFLLGKPSTRGPLGVRPMQGGRAAEPRPSAPLPAGVPTAHLR